MPGEHIAHALGVRHAAGQCAEPILIDANTRARRIPASASYEGLQVIPCPPVNLVVGSGRQRLYASLARAPVEQEVWNTLFLSYPEFSINSRCSVGMLSTYYDYDITRSYSPSG